MGFNCIYISFNLLKGSKANCQKKHNKYMALIENDNKTIYFALFKNKMKQKILSVIEFRHFIFSVFLNIVIELIFKYKK